MLRDEMREKLKVVLASKMRNGCAAGGAGGEIAALTARSTRAGGGRWRRWTGSTRRRVHRGLRVGPDAAKDAGAQANQRALELERGDARHQTNMDRVAELEARMAAAQSELAQAREHLHGMAGSGRRSAAFLEKAAAECGGSREAAQAQQQRAQEAMRAVAAAEQQSEESAAPGDAVAAAARQTSGIK